MGRWALAVSLLRLVLCSTSLVRSFARYPSHSSSSSASAPLRLPVPAALRVTGTAKLTRVSSGLLVGSLIFLLRFATTSCITSLDAVKHTSVIFQILLLNNQCFCSFWGKPMKYRSSFSQLGGPHWICYDPQGRISCGTQVSLIKDHELKLKRYLIPR